MDTAYAPVWMMTNFSVFLSFRGKANPLFSAKNFAFSAVKPE